MTAPVGQSVDIEFSTFDLKEPDFSTKCYWFDWILILDSEGGELVSQSCGTEKPDKVSFTNKALQPLIFLVAPESIIRV